MPKDNYLALFGSIILCNLAGIIGSVFTIPAIPGWYANLVKPFFTPPNWIFAPAWTILYILMGISLYLILRDGKKAKNYKLALGLFGSQLILNALWSIIFFGFNFLIVSSVEILTLWIFILLTILEFRKISKTAAYLLIPYICWVSFAAVLNISILVLNF